MEVWRCVAVPLSCSVLSVVDSAGRLDRQLAIVAAYVDDLRGLLHSDSRASLLVNALTQAILTAQQLRQHALRAATSADDAAIDVHERALRARLNIVARALYALKSNERDVPVSAFTGALHSFRDASAYLVEHLARIHDRWQEQRAAEEQLDSSARQAIAYASVDDAEIAFERLGRDEALGHFLRVGAGCASVSVATACREIAATLGLSVTDTQHEERARQSSSNVFHEDRAS